MSAAIWFMALFWFWLFLWCWDEDTTENATACIDEHEHHHLQLAFNAIDDGRFADAHYHLMTALNASELAEGRVAQYLRWLKTEAAA